MLIKAGSTLLVRRSAGFDTDVSERVADNGQLSLSPEVVLRQTAVKAGKRDTVASLAKRFRVSPQSLADWNQVSANASFKVGQKVVLYLPGKALAARTMSAKKASDKPRAVASRKAPALKKPVRLARR
jgi:membrane-bound lytic murein transglycosylase D